MFKVLVLVFFLNLVSLKNLCGSPIVKVIIVQFWFILVVLFKGLKLYLELNSVDDSIHYCPFAIVLNSETVNNNTPEFIYDKLLTCWKTF